jgi:putative ABC transport system permease protein
MFLKTILTAMRNIRKYKLNSIINIGGLTIGFCAFMLIGLFVKYEYSWDKSNVKYQRIYRVQQVIDKKGEIWTQIPANVPSLLEKRYPEVEKAVLYCETWGQFLSTDGREQFFESYGAYTDPAFFDIFTYKFLYGNPQTALNQPASIILSQYLARKFFPKGSALGKSITLDKKFTFTVTGVYDDLPQNCTIKPTYLLSFDAFEKVTGWKNFRSDMGSSSFRAFVLLKPGINSAQLDRKIANINQNNPKFRDARYFLLPMSQFYLKPVNKDDYMVALFGYFLIAVFILLLVSINFINYTIANASVRANEIAVRKVNGSSRFNLVMQFITESFLTVVISVVLAFALADLALPFFNRVVVREISFSFPGSTAFIAWMLIGSAGMGLLASIYPAFYLSSIKSYTLLRGKLFHSTKSLLRKTLVTFQFVISLLLISGSIILIQQLNYMVHKDLGFNKENLLFTLVKSSNKSGSFDDLRNRMLKYPEITDACFSENLPFYWSNGLIVGWEGGLPNDRINIRTNRVNYDFIRVMDMKIIAGRGFSRDFVSDSAKSCIINETAVRTFGWKDPLGKTIDNGRWHVIGIVKDFHPFSVHEKIPPFLLELNRGDMDGAVFYTFRIAPGKMQEAKQILEAEFAKFFPNDPFQFINYSLFFSKDETFKTYGTIRNTFLFFTILNILLTIFGLLGLISFATQRRTKEIGIRKINGGSVGKIYFMLNKEYLLLLLIASFIAIPVNIYMYPFLPFNYRFGLSPWVFVWSILVLVLISVATTGYFTYKAARRNPSETLRYE